MQDRIPPQSLEMEQATLSAMMYDEAAIAAARRIVTAADFYRQAHGMIFTAICDLNDRGEVADLLKIQDVLNVRGQLEKCGGAPYLFCISDAAPAAAKVEAYAGVVKEKAVLRKLIAHANRCVDAAHSDYEELSEMLAAQERDLLAISQSIRTGKSRGLQPVSQHLSSVMEDLEQRQEYAKAGRPIPGIRTGLSEVDYLIGTIEPTKYVVIGARPSVGKTALAIQIGLRAAREGKNVAFFSLEMDMRSIIYRLLGVASHVDTGRMRDGTMEESDWRKVGHNAGLLTQMGIHICDEAALTVADIAAYCRQLHSSTPVDLIVADYLQLMKTSVRGGNRNDQVAQLSADTSALGKEFNCPVLVAAQLNREAEKRGGEPQTSDLRDSGGIEADADIILMPWHIAPIKGFPYESSIVGIKVAKARDRRQGRAAVQFIGAYGAFLELPPDVEHPFKGDK